MFAVGVTVAALFAHVAVDVVGDVALPHDAYDDVAHGSRFVLVAALLVVAIGSTISFFRSLRARARRDRYHPRPSAPSPLRGFALVRYVAVVAVLGDLGMMAIEGADTLTAGRAVDDLGDLLAGAPAFALGVGTIAGALAGGALVLLARFARAVGETLTAVVVARLAVVRDATSRTLGSGLGTPILARRRLAVRHDGLRAPPLST